MNPEHQTDLTILVDVHEQACGLPELLKANDFFTVSEQLLSAGDIVLGDLGIERKAALDLVDSLVDGRLFRQLILLKRIYRRRMLIIEGSPVATTRVSGRALQGALLKVAGSLQIPIVRTRDVNDTAQKVLHLAYQILIARPGQIQERSLRDPDTRSFYQRFILAGVPGIGIVRAQALLEHFGSLRAVFDAPAAAIAEVSGIGPIHAQRIVELATFKVQGSLCELGNGLSPKTHAKTGAKR